MVTNLTSSNLDEVKTTRRCVGFSRASHIFVLVTGPKGAAMFVPLQHDADYRYNCKNAKAAIKAAVMAGENVVVCESEEEFLRHFLAN